MNKPARKRTTISAIVVMVTALVAQLFIASAASPASAAATCTMRANLPAHIVLDHTSIVTRVTLSGCPGVASAYTSLAGPDGLEDFLSWRGTRVANMTTFSAWTSPGTYYTYDGGGYYSDFNHPVNWHDTSTVIKFGTRIGMTASRSGQNVKFLLAINRYDPYDGFIGWTNKAVNLQQSGSPRGPWTLVAKLRVNSAGTLTYTRHVAKSRYYRATFGDDNSHFGSTGPVLRK